MSQWGGPPGGAPPGHHDPFGHEHHQHHPDYSHESYNQAPPAQATPEVTGQIVKISSEAAKGFNLGILNGEVTIVTANDSDPHQLWIKDESWSTKAKDSAGLPAFSLINKATGAALKHPQLREEKVTVTPYHQNSLNEGVLWTESKDVGHGWHALRPVNNIKLNLDIDHGNKKYGPVKEGQAIIVFEWDDLENQHWKIEPVGANSTSHQQKHRW